MDCKVLEQKLPGKVFFQGEKGDTYDQTVGTYFAAYENELSPMCVVRPSSAEDVATIVKTFNHTASSSDAKMAIRGGGHTPWAGSANIGGGVTVDLGDLDDIEIHDADATDEDFVSAQEDNVKQAPVKPPRQRKTVSTGGGAKWREVYKKLSEQQLAVVGGRAAKVGVGGLTTGGGLSYFSAAEGFVCDNVLKYQVVLASGEIVEVNKESHSDLFQALKGGSNNFGIVTRFDFPVFDQGQMWGGAIFHASTAYQELAKAFYDFAADPTPDERAHILVATSWNNGTEYGVSNVYHSDPKPDPPSLAPFTKIEPQLLNTIRQDSLLGFTEEQAAFSMNGQRQWYFTTTVKLDLQLLSDLREVYLKYLEPFKPLNGMMLSMVLQPLTKGMLKKSQEHADNSLGLSPEDGPLVIVLMSEVHADAEDDNMISSTVLKLIDEMQSLAQKRGKSARYRFTNYGYKTQEILQGYGEENLDRLRAVSEKYDPNGFFQTRVPGGFKLSAVK
ncbi:MAG: hypothetical protein M1831_002870 [Alyxoria varia]|nr:MAG: hypothetical protein M1831_002870 [Alyxoria varia]